MRRFWSALGEIVSRRYKLVLAVALVATIALALGIPGLRFETSQNSLIGASNPVSKDNEAFQSHFGGEVMLVLLTGQHGTQATDLFSPANLPRLRQLEQRLRATGQFHAVIGPYTALEFANNQVAVGPQMLDAASTREQQLARERVAKAGGSAAEQAAAAKEQADHFQTLLQENTDRATAAIAAGVKQGLANPQSLENPAWVKFLLYEDAANTKIRPILLDNFPDATHGLVVVRLKGNIPIADMGKGVDTVKRIAGSTKLDGFTVLSAGAPVFLKDINDYLQGGMATLGGLAVLVMVLLLWFVFRVRWRLLSLAIVVIGAIWTFGIMGYLDIPLTLITISGLPILIGIGVDFAIQTHSRFEEELDHDGDAHGAIHRLMVGLVPAIAVSMIAATLGFLSLQLSEVPLIRDFGVMLAIGVAALIVAAVAVPSSILAWREHRRPTPAGQASVLHGTLERVVRSVAFSGRRVLVPLLVVGAIVFVAGFAVEGRFTIQTDAEKWIPQDSQTIKDLDRLRADTGFSTEFSLLVQADDVTATPVATWMQRFTDEEVGKHHQVLLRGTSLAAVAASVTGVPPGQTEMQLLLGKALDTPPVYDVAPKPFVESFISRDKHSAALIFPIAPVSLNEQQRLISAIKADLAQPPAGVTAQVVGGPPPGTTVRPAGLAAVGVELVQALQANRTLMTYVALGVVALWLLIYFRRLTLMVLPLVPVAISVGLASLVVYATGIELSPLTSVSGPLVIAIATEFSVLVHARYVEEREHGRSRHDAVAHGAVRIGRAFVASGLTVVGGFGVLAFSAFPLLRDFGIVVALDVLVALISTLVILPPLLQWADKNPRLRTFSPGAGAATPEREEATPSDGSSG